MGGGGVADVPTTIFSSHVNPPRHFLYSFHGNINRKSVDQGFATRHSASLIIFVLSPSSREQEDDDGDDDTDPEQYHDTLLHVQGDRVRLADYRGHVHRCISHAYG